MRYLLLICSDPTGEPYDPALDTIEEWVDGLQSRNAYVLGDRLRTVEDSATVRLRAGERSVVSGPDPASGEDIVGFDVIDAADRDDALAIAAAHPMARFGRIELRPVWPL